MDGLHDTEISAFVREVLPDAPREVLLDAERCYEEFMGVLLRIYRRLDAEGHFSYPHDKTDRRDTLKGKLPTSV